MDDLDLGLTLKGFAPGQKLFGRYTLQKMLGRGGMGVVWLARDEELGRETALKFLPEVVAADRSAIEDLKREVRRAINLSHPHIVKIHDFVTDGRTAAVSMEYVKGDTLSSLRIDQPGHVFTTAQLAPWVGQLCSALDYAHAEAEVVHRDLKPANLMVDARGRLKVLDFGIAASLSESVTRVSKQAGSSGTPLYMSPQQMMGEKPAVTDDIYALGATLYELLTGKPPFYAGNIIRQVEIKVPPGLTARREELGVTDAAPIPAEWETAIAACLAKQPAGRPQSAGEVAERLGLAPSANVQRSTGGQTGAAATSLRTERTEVGASPVQPRTPNPKSKTPLFAGVAAVVVCLAGLGYYFGVHAPEQQRLAEIKRLESEGKAAEAQKLRNQQELAAAEAKAQAERERLAAERLANARGGIVVRTTPAGAEVRVGAIALEKSPLTLKDQKLGKYPVRVRAEGHEDWTGEIEVKENDFADLDVALIRSTGTVAFTSDPTGLQAEIVGSALAAGSSTRNVPVQRVWTPATLKLPTGTYDITFRRIGWPEQKQAIEVTRNQSSTAAAEFASGGLQLTSLPAGAEVWQGGKQFGTTPYRVADMIPGRYEFELKQKGYKPASVGLTVTARQTVREEVLLEKLLPQQGKAWENTLGMRFLPLTGGLLMAETETRVADYREFVQETGHRTAAGTNIYSLLRGGWAPNQGHSWDNPGFPQTENHPITCMVVADVDAFCRWLTDKERGSGDLRADQSYRLATVEEWTEACRRPNGSIPTYPWGENWPAPRDAGNLAGDEAKDADWPANWVAITGRNDGYARTSPVGSFPPNERGFRDLTGNVGEIFRAPDGSIRVYGFGWPVAQSTRLTTAHYEDVVAVASVALGFRVVLVTGSR